MVRKESGLGVFIFVSILIVFFMGLASAEFTVGDKSHSIATKYGQSENVTGWVNISLDNELGSSLFQDSLDNSMSLINLLRTNSSYLYTCSPLDCTSSYNSSNGETSKVSNIE